VPSLFSSLKRGGTIGIVAPACWAKPAWIVSGKKFLEKHGYKVVVHPQNYLRQGQLAGNDTARANALMDMFANPDINAVMCARGGYGAIRLLDLLDYKLIKHNQKPFIGFSDITVLLNTIAKRCGIITYHGPMITNFVRQHHRRTVEDFLNLLQKNKRDYIFPQIDCVRAGQAQGKIAGGNLMLLQSMIGTPDDWSGKNTILFVEDVDEPLYKIDRLLCHLRRAGNFEGLRAVLVGEMVDVSDSKTGFVRKGEKPYGRDLQEIFLDNLPPTIPLCFNFPCGHGRYLTTLPIGAKATVNLSKRGARLRYS
jgi:muramoyltetrapeptide carboxypeptidase